MPVLGITGGIASGKSTFRQMLLERVQAEMFDSDACARDLLEQDTVVREEVLREVHPLAYDAEGKPDRALLRDVIYHDSARKQALENILHPRIRQSWLEKSKSVKARGAIFVVDIPLLFETGAEAFIDVVAVVACSRETQLRRLQTRGLDPEISEKIIASQMPMSVKIARAHHVIWNDGPLEALISQTELFSSYLNDRFG